MMLLALIAVVLVPFAFFWWAGRGLKRNEHPTEESEWTALGGPSDPPTSGHDGIHH